MASAAPHLFAGSDRAFVEAVARLSHADPFSVERVSLEREALGGQYQELGQEVWHRASDYEKNPNLPLIDQRLAALLERARPRLVEKNRKGDRPSEETRRLWRDLVLYHLYNLHQGDLGALIARGGVASTRPVAIFPALEKQIHHWINDPDLGMVERLDASLCLGWFFQLRRAFHFVFGTFAGASKPAAALRSAVWQSIFTHDMRRYRRGLYDRMGDVTTLITGPSGTGKELVARAIGLSRFIPFDQARQAFAEDFEGAFFALNLVALSPTLIESELFGHQRGAFTGAVADREGWFEVCPPLGSVFLDEIGEIDETIQVKLLRVLQTRTFQRLGDTETRRFRGKLIAATNREPEVEMAEGRMREDFYYRICSDIVRTPSLREQLDDAPSELGRLIATIAGRMVGASEADSLAAETTAFVRQNLGSEYPWRGNFRELEQCVRNVLVRGSYHPAGGEAVDPPGLAGFLARLEVGDLDADELLSGYTTLVYSKAGSYVEAARRLGLDRRTVKARIDSALLEALAGAKEHE